MIRKFITQNDSLLKSPYYIKYLGKIIEISKKIENTDKRAYRHKTRHF